MQLGNQPPLGRFGPGEFGQADRVGIVGPLKRQRARCAQRAALADGNKPIAFGDMEITAKLIVRGGNGAGMVAFVAFGDHQQGQLVE